MSKDQMQKNMDKARKEMEKAAKELDFMEAAHFRDEIQSYKKLLQEKFGEG